MLKANCFYMGNIIQIIFTLGFFMKRIFFSCLFLLFAVISCAAQELKSWVDQSTPSNSQYFSWINNTNEGPASAQTLINFEFFRWMKEEFGMVLDIYAFDAGAVDGANFYGNMNSKRFMKQFPGGFGPLSKEAALMNTRLGIWGGPDGFGSTEEEEKSRTELMISLCRDYNFKLFKMDAVCGQLRPEKYDAFDRMMSACREYSPDLILLNHRLDLGPGTKHSTTYLFGGAETYIDVHMANDITASHHRACALKRELPPGLTRLTEDHGVCLSSCLDYWEDDLILQAFNRNLILAPQIYANPWLLNDREFPKLAFIFNLHRQYRDILVNGLVLPEKEYGPNAVSRGDENIRLLTLRNLTWMPVKYTLSLDQSIGLKESSKLTVTQYHPYIELLGEFGFGSQIQVEVLPFRTCLVKISGIPEQGFEIAGGPYEIIRDIPGKPVKIKLLGMPGKEYSFRFTQQNTGFSKAELEAQDVSSILKGKKLKINFEGEELKNNYHRKISEMEKCEVPDDAEALYYATCYAADNNALEVRSLNRSGSSAIPQVENARNAFFNQQVFKGREVWDKYLFDSNPKSAFSSSMLWGDQRLGNSSFLLDLGTIQHLDKLIIKTFDEYSLQPLKSEEGVTAYVSKDLNNWTAVVFLAGQVSELDLSNFDSIRYLRFNPAPLRISEIEGYNNNIMVSRENWRASNLFKTYVSDHWWSGNIFKAQKCWLSEFVLDEIPENSYLCVAINGAHGAETAYASFEIDGKYVGCPDRSPSYPSNTWEVPVRKVDKNYTYYLHLTPDMKGKPIKAYVMAFNPDLTKLTPEIWITSYPIPFQEKELILYRYAPFNVSEWEFSPSGLLGPVQLKQIQN